MNFASITSIDRWPTPPRGTLSLAGYVLGFGPALGAHAVRASLPHPALLPENFEEGASLLCDVEQTHTDLAMQVAREYDLVAEVVLCRDAVRH